MFYDLSASYVKLSAEQRKNPEHPENEHPSLIHAKLGSGVGSRFESGNFYLILFLYFILFFMQHVMLASFFFFCNTGINLQKFCVLNTHLVAYDVLL